MYHGSKPLVLWIVGKAWYIRVCKMQDAHTISKHPVLKIVLKLSQVEDHG